MAFLLLGVIAGWPVSSVSGQETNDLPSEESSLEDEAKALQGEEALSGGNAEPQTDLATMKAEWEAVREKQIEMIREKEVQLEKLKEEIFQKMKAMDQENALSQAPLIKASSDKPEDEKNLSKERAELEIQKKALQEERQKFFQEMNRQKEKLRELQTATGQKTEQAATR